MVEVIYVGLFLFGPFIKLDPECKLLIRCVHCRGFDLCEYKKLKREEGLDG